LSVSVTTFGCTFLSFSWQSRLRRVWV
jgi:hypothetical protein